MKPAGSLRLQAAGQRSHELRLSGPLHSIRTLRYRWLVIASTVAVMLVLMAGLQFITASNDWRDNC